VSLLVHDAAIRVLARTIRSPSVDLGDETLLADVRRNLATTIGRGKVGKARDIEMVISTLRYLSRLHDYNIEGISRLWRVVAPVAR
jgi:hypothetical protein